MRHYQTVFLILLLAGCRQSSIPPPVEIFPEDNCASCRMALSQPRFASEIITTSGVVRKFDDLNCLEEYRTNHPNEKIAVIWLKDYLNNAWINADSCLVIRTSLATPMGSGLIAATDSGAARQIQAQYPPADGQFSGAP